MTSKYSKLKWNHKPQASTFTAKFWRHCYGRWEYRSWKMVVELLFPVTFSWQFLTSISFDLSLNIARERTSKKTLLLLNIALDQSAPKKALNYWKKQFGEVIIFLVDDPVLYVALALKTLGCLRVTKSEKTLAFDLKNNWSTVVK